MVEAYRRLGLRPVINAAGAVTRFGGVPLPDEVVQAMVEASGWCVPMEELQEAAGQVIAEATGAEAGYVTSGAAAGLTLATAACLARLDVDRMDRLPDTTGMPNEVIVQRAHRNAYDHAVRAAGARFVEVGYLGYPGAGGTHPWQIEAAITEKTAALYWAVMDDNPGVVPLPTMCEIAHRHDLPVIVDAAAALPPPDYLRRFIAAGADVVTFSGGKAIMGPQASGILCGRRDLIESVLLQHQDMDVHPEVWSYRARYLDTGLLPGPPHQGLGRGFKVGKEEIVGLITALQIYVRRDHAADRARWDTMARAIAEGLAALPHIHVTVTSPAAGVPRAQINLDEAALGMTAFEVIRRLLDGDPRVAVGEGRARRGGLVVNPMALKDDDVGPLVDRLTSALSHVVAAQAF